MRVRLTALQGPQFGRYDILIDGGRIETADLRAAEEGELDLLLGTRELSRGTHQLTFQALDLPQSGGPARAGPLAVEMVRLLKLPPPATRLVKTHNEAHFIRLGIGRALYAYRLAYGELPDSLDTLVRTGIMPARYLNDENERPLKSHREGDELVVESPAAGGWSHRWQGLDPRREGHGHSPKAAGGSRAEATESRITQSRCTISGGRTSWRAGAGFSSAGASLAQDHERPS